MRRRLRLAHAAAILRVAVFRTGPKLDRRDRTTLSRGSASTIGMLSRRARRVLLGRSGHGHVAASLARHLSDAGLTLSAKLSSNGAEDSSMKCLFLLAMLAALPAIAADRQSYVLRAGG